jgi:hypothetical protein
MKKSKTIVSNKQAHRWRLCPYGEHWVKEHSKTIKEKEYVWNGVKRQLETGTDDNYNYAFKSIKLHH